MNRKTLSDNLLTNSNAATAFIDAGKEQPKNAISAPQKIQEDELVSFSTRIPKSLLVSLSDYCHEAKKAKDGRPFTQQAVITQALENWLNN